MHLLRTRRISVTFLNIMKLNCNFNWQWVLHRTPSCPDSDKCIPDKWRCDEYDDCPDAADETDCPFGDESRTLPTTQGHGRTFPYTQELSASRAAVGTGAGTSSSTYRPYQLATAASDGGLVSKQRSSSSAVGAAPVDELVAEASGIPLLPTLSKSLGICSDSRVGCGRNEFKSDLFSV